MSGRNLRVRRGHGYAMALMIVVVLVITTLTTAMITSAYSELRSTRRATVRSDARAFATRAVDEIYARISTTPRFLDTILDSDPSTFPSHPAVGSTNGVAKWALLSDPTVSCGTTFTNDCYHIDIYVSDTSYSAGGAARAITVEATIRQRCGGSQSGCVTQRFQQRLRQVQFFDYLYFNQFSTLDPSQYPSADQIATAATQCADRYATRFNGALGPRTSWCSNVAFHGNSTSTDVISGPVYTADDYVTVCGSPQFNRSVSVAGAGSTLGASQVVYKQATSACADPDRNSATPALAPTFTTTYLNSPLLLMPSATTSFATAQRLAGYRVTQTTTDPATLTFSVVTPTSGTPYTVMSFTGATVSHSGGVSVSPGQLTLANNSVVTVSNNVNVSGTIYGRLSLFASGDINIVGDLRYRNGGSATNTTDVLGLTAGGSVVINKSASGRTVHALILSLTGSVRTAAWRTVDSGGSTTWAPPTLTFYGAMATKYQGVFGGFDVNNGFLVSGYRKLFTFDSRSVTDARLVPPYLVSPVASSWERLDLVELAT